MAKKRLIQAIREGLIEEMRRDPKVIVLGEDVEISISGDTRGLVDEFGRTRVRNMPISETLLTGMTVGAAIAGYRPVAHLMFANFMYTGFDSIANQAAKLRFMTGGQVCIPATFIATYGGGRSIAAHHSDTPYPLLMNLGGINVCVPSNAADAKGLLKSCIRGSNPCVFLEPGGRGGDLGEVPDEDYIIPLGKAALLREGDDVTVVAIGTMVKPTLNAATTLLEQYGIAAEVIDPRTLVPLDEETILHSVARTRRLIIVDESRDRCSAASHIAAVVADKGFRHLQSPIKRVTVPNVAMPYAPVLERSVLPDAEKVVNCVVELLQEGGVAPKGA
jgi:pyruvate/2-oxoglutarate/acetoin dehydrogenase E1 component